MTGPEPAAGVAAGVVGFQFDFTGKRTYRRRAAEDEDLELEDEGSVATVTAASEPALDGADGFGLEEGFDSRFCADGVAVGGQQTGFYARRGEG